METKTGIKESDADVGLCLLDVERRIMFPIRITMKFYF